MKISPQIKGVHIHRKKKLVSIDLSTFNDALEELNQDVIKRTEKKWWCLWKCETPAEGSRPTENEM